MTTKNRASGLASAINQRIASAETTTQQSSPIPHDEPFVTIEPRRRLGFSSFKELWTYRELLYFLVWRDVKVRYKQTILGVGWVVMQPLLTTLVFTIFLGVLIQVPSDGIPYPLFAFSGLLLWTFFSSAVTSACTSIVGNSHLVTKIYFPRTIIPIAAVLARLIDFAVGVMILAAMMLYYRVEPTWTILNAPLAIILVVFLALGLGLWSAALNVTYRDVGVAIPVLLQLAMFVSPIAYSPNLVPLKWRWLYDLNPMVGVIELFRASLFGRVQNWRTISFSALIVIVLIVSGWYFFWRVEKTFSDTV